MRSVSTFPADVERAAKAVAIRICPHTMPTVRASFIEKSWPVIAEAIMADRASRPPSPAATGMRLTAKQQGALDYLRLYIAENGVAPSYEVMFRELGLNSKSGVHRMILALEERGHIRRLPGRARAIEVLS